MTSTAAGAADPLLFDVTLEAAVRHFQKRHRLGVDGAVGPATQREMNVPVQARIDQLRLNLERGRWVLHELQKDDDLVVVDIAGFGVRFLRDRKTLWQTRAVVGRPYRQTPIFKSAIDHVVLNPTWTVPPTILDKDVLPAVKKDRGYLAKHGLEVIDRSGRPVPVASIDFSRYSGRNFPYMIRQGAGDDNALGQVKIMFPNPYLVYLHDTPSKALFDKDERAFSSGCIRTERPLELVELLLADPVRWNLAALDAAQRSQALLAAELLPQSELGWRSALAAYENGKVDFATLLEAQRNIRQGRVSHLQAQVQARLRLAEIERLVGEAL